MHGSSDHGSLLPLEVDVTGITFPLLSLTWVDETWHFPLQGDRYARLLLRIASLGRPGKVMGAIGGRQPERVMGATSSIGLHCVQQEAFA